MTQRTGLRLLILICLGILVLPYGKAFAYPPLTIFVNGERLKTDVDPFILDGRTMVPMRPLLERLGSRVTWNERDQSIRAESDSHRLYATVGAHVAVVDDIRYALDVAPVVRNGRTFLPARFVAEALGATVSWDSMTRSVHVWTTLVPSISAGEYDRAKALLTPYVRRYGHTVYLSLPPEGVRLLPSVMQAVLKEMTTVNDYLNHRIRNPLPTFAPDNMGSNPGATEPHHTCPFHSDGPCDSTVVESFAAQDWDPTRPLHRIQGRNMDFRTYWWGFEWYLDEVATRKVILAIRAVAASSSALMEFLKLLSPIFPQVSVGAIAVHAVNLLLIAGTSFLEFCNAAQKGIIFRTKFGFPHCLGRD